MHERASYRLKEKSESFSVFAGAYRTDPYDYSNIVVHTRRLLGHPQRGNVVLTDAKYHGEYVGLYTDTPETLEKLNQIGRLFAAQPVSRTIHAISTAYWGALLGTLTDVNTARQQYQLSEDVADHTVDLLATRGLRTGLERGREMLFKAGDAPESYVEAVLDLLPMRHGAPVDPFTPEDLAGLAMPVMRQILREHPLLKP